MHAAVYRMKDRRWTLRCTKSSYGKRYQNGKSSSHCVCPSDSTIFRIIVSVGGSAFPWDRLHLTTGDVYQVYDIHIHTACSCLWEIGVCFLGCILSYGKRCQNGKVFFYYRVCHPKNVQREWASVSHKKWRRDRKWRPPQQPTWKKSCTYIRQPKAKIRLYFVTHKKRLLQT